MASIPLLSSAPEVILNDVTSSAMSLQLNETSPTCAEHAPSSNELLSSLSAVRILLVLIMVTLTIATLFIYVEEILFIMKRFSISERRKKTIWVLAFFPVFSVCSIIAILVPKSGPLVHMCANVFFCTCLYQILRLIVSYMGGQKRIWEVIEKDRRIQLNTLPLCCCCPCCPTPLFNRKNFIKVTLLVMQIAIVRPIVLFISAVLWTDSLHLHESQQIYAPGVFSPRRSFVWLAIINVISTCLAVYGLIITSRALGRELEKDFLIRGKIVSIQGTLIMTVIPNIIIGGLVGSGVIGCTEILPAKVRGEEIYFGILVIIMLPFSLLGRRNFRRASDGNDLAASESPDDQIQSITGLKIGGGTEAKTLLVRVDEKPPEIGADKIVVNNNIDRDIKI